MKRSNDVISFPNEPPAKVKRLDPLSTDGATVRPDLNVTKVHIIQAKIDSNTIFELFSLVENHGRPVHSRRQHAQGRRSADELNLELCGDVRQADVVVTALRMRKRFERHVDWDVAVSAATPTGIHISTFVEREGHCDAQLAL